MSPETSIAATVGAIALVQLLISLGLYAWGRWVARRHGGRFWRRASLLPFAGLATAVIGIAWTAVHLVRSFAAVSSVDPSEKATLLAKNISSATHVTVVFAPLSWLSYLAALVIFIVGSARKPRVAGPPSA